MYTTVFAFTIKLLMKELHIGQGFEYQTIHSAIEKSKPGDVLILEDNEYIEKVVIDKEGITIEGKNNATIVYNDYAEKIHQDGRPYITFRTYTVLVKANNVTLKNLTIKNTAGYGKEIGQAVALSLYANNIKIINCKLSAHQDTLFIGPFSKDLEERYVDLLPLEERIADVNYYSTFENTEIEGNVDFIFGGGNATFNNCKIISIKANGKSWVCAPDHPLSNKHGFVFNDCEFLNKGAEEGSVYLARPWRTYGFVTLNRCYLDKHINKDGFDIWQKDDPRLPARFYENNSYGPGKNNERKIATVVVK